MIDPASPSAAPAGVYARQAPRPSVRIGLVDDHAVVRAGLRHYLHLAPDLRVVWEAADATEATIRSAPAALDVLVMDLMMPGPNAIDAMAEVRTALPDTPILIYSGYAEDQYAASALREGARGYLTKGCDPQEIMAAVRTLHAGHRHISPRVAEALARRLTEEPRAASHQRLSSREFQVFLKLAQGCAPAEAAAALSLSPKAVSTYRTRVLDKLELRSNSELTYYAVKHRLIL